MCILFLGAENSNFWIPVVRSYTLFTTVSSSFVHIERAKARAANIDREVTHPPVSPLLPRELHLQTLVHARTQIHKYTHIRISRRSDGMSAILTGRSVTWPQRLSRGSGRCGRYRLDFQQRDRLRPWLNICQQSSANFDRVRVSSRCIMARN